MPRDWPSLVIGLLMGFYWYRVLRKAWHVKKRTGRAANLWPAETVGRILRIFWYPIVAIWIVHPLAQAFARKPKPWALPRVFSTAAERSTVGYSPDLAIRSMARASCTRARATANSWFADSARATSESS